MAVGAVLSQRRGTMALLHLVAFVSCKLSPAKRNYDVGDRELLAKKNLRSRNVATYWKELLIPFWSSPIIETSSTYG